jgi:diguanylate cyclase (GGDEF)-like protein
VVARYRGEEFVLVVPGIGAAGLPAMGQKLVEPFRADGRIGAGDRVHALTVSVGLTAQPVGPGSERSLGELVEAADAALFQAKQGGRDRYVVGRV